jgi:hypothetical protein
VPIIRLHNFLLDRAESRSLDLDARAIDEFEDAIDEQLSASPWAPDLRGQFAPRVAACMQR